MAVTIKLKNASGSDPSASDLVVGEVAIRTDNGKLFTKKDDNSVAEISGGGIDDGDKGDITVSNSGATFTIDNSVITSAKIADGAIVNADVSNSAAITGNKLADDTIVNAKIDSAAAIAGTKISPDFGSQDIVTTGHIDLPDDSEIKLGTGDDLQIYHNGTSGFIDSTGNDTLFIRNGTTGGKIKIQGNSGEDSIICNHNGSVELYEDNTKRLETSDSGVTVTGTLVATAFTGPLTGNVTGNASGSSGSCTGNAATATALANARTIAGVSFDGTGNISLNNNAITNGAGYITATLTTEQVEDIVGGMLTGNTETGITVTYQDGDGTIDFVVGTLNQDTTGSAATLTTARTIAGVSFDGSANISLNNNAITNGAGYITSSGTSAACSGNAATATKLASARTIAGVSFDGSANISLNNNAITNGAGYITATLTEEQVEDFVGGMVTGNTETGITVTYQDSDGTLDFVVASQTDNNFTNADHSKLDGIESGATADQSASEILTLIKTVDGSGSGLDADNLDGRTWSTSASNSTIVSRNGSGYVFANYFNTTANDVSSGVTKVMVETGNDNYIRHGSAAAIRTFINVADGATNVTNNNQLTNGAGYVTTSGGPTGGGSDKIFTENAQAVTTNYTIGDTFGAACNAMAAGPITINSGVTVTVNSGETLTIV